MYYAPPQLGARDRGVEKGFDILDGAIENLSFHGAAYGSDYCRADTSRVERAKNPEAEGARLCMEHMKRRRSMATTAKVMIVAAGTAGYFLGRRRR